jgi:hypothetical protein
MSQAKSVVHLYYVPQSFPCGPQSSCCGPTGQSEEDVQRYVKELETRVPGVRVETVDASKKLSLGRDLPVAKLLNAFGVTACPIVALNGEVVSMGPPTLSELVKLVKEKLSAKV